MPYNGIHFPWQDAEDGDLPQREEGKEVGKAGVVAKVGPHSSEEVGAVVQKMIEEIDEGVGRIVGALRRQGLEKNTLVIFMSDNGGYTMYPYQGTPTRISSNGPFRGAKGSAYEGGHRVPAIAWWPGKIAPNAVTAETAVTMDWVPTALELAGVPLPARNGPNALDGVSLAGVVLHREALPPRMLVWESPPDAKGKTRWGVREGPWKLVESELYNLAQDPSEQHDLAAQQPKRAREMTAKRMAWEQAIRASKHLPPSTGGGVE